ncbi:hypothetical protein [Azospirillum sp.]|uniref:hypothetical protein n=1 Tax=Azospirillum sp. TaxID=34012 RepID=UPI002D6F7624|nr:hypothetical protein [Azospirillum sp.]HYD66173.1 hypothetical protein [Azospirillum sp.]
MTDIVITAANVVASPSATRVHGTAGETIAQGKLCYLDPTSRKWMLADSNSATAAARQGSHVALNAASLNQPITLGKGKITIGATLTPGLAYYGSDTPGGICPIADVGSGEYVNLVGLADSASVLDVQPHYTAVAN